MPLAVTFSVQRVTKDVSQADDGLTAQGTFEKAQIYQVVCPEIHHNASLPGRLRQEGYEFKVSLDYRGRDLSLTLSHPSMDDDSQNL